jgi:hypothetical protein
MLCISGNSDFIISYVTITIKYQRSVFSNHSSLGDLSIPPHIPLILHLYTSKITVLPTTVFLICLRECQTETGATMNTMDRSISVRAVGKPGKRWEDEVWGGQGQTILEARLDMGCSATEEEEGGGEEEEEEGGGGEEEEEEGGGSGGGSVCHKTEHAKVWSGQRAVT